MAVWGKGLAPELTALRVQDFDGEIYEVDLERDECSCDRNNCKHAKHAWRFARRDKDAEYEAVSAFHKELRRGDVASALVWARHVERMRGDLSVKQYLKSIVFEETRNLSLYTKWKVLPPLDLEGMILDFCGSLKKWELPAVSGMYSIVLSAFAAGKLLPPITIEELKKTPAVQTEFEFYAWMSLIGRLFWLGVWDTGRFESREVAHARRTLSVTLCRALLAEGHDKEAAILQEKQDYHRLCTGAEALCGFKDKRGSSIKRVEKKTVAVDLFMTPDYAFDSHTAEGRRRLKAGWPVPGERPPSGVDLRWTGKEIGAYWRYKAFEQFAENYRDQPWENVKPLHGEVPRVAETGPF